MENKFEGITFENQKIHLDNKSFSDCKFIGCELIYSGGNYPSLVNCGFLEGTHFDFEGAASNTIHFLHAMNHGGMRGLVHSLIVGLSSPNPLKVKAM